MGSRWEHLSSEAGKQEQPRCAGDPVTPVLVAFSSGEEVRDSRMGLTEVSPLLCAFIH